MHQENRVRFDIRTAKKYASSGWLLTYSLNVSVNNIACMQPSLQAAQASQRTRQQTSMCVSLYIVHTSTVVHRQ